MTTQKNDEYKDAMLTAGWHLRNLSGVYHLPTIGLYLGELMNAIKALGYGKGYAKNIEYDVDDREFTFRLAFYDKDFDNESFRHTAKVTESGGVWTALNALYDDVSKLRPHDDKMRLKWKQKLADLVTEGENLNIGVEYTRMLEETARKLSSNALEGPRDLT